MLRRLPAQPLHCVHRAHRGSVHQPAQLLDDEGIGEDADADADAGSEGGGSEAAGGEAARHALPGSVRLVVYLAVLACRFDLEERAPIEEFHDTEWDRTETQAPQPGPAPAQTTIAAAGAPVGGSVLRPAKAPRAVVHMDMASMIFELEEPDVEAHAAALDAPDTEDGP